MYARARSDSTASVHPPPASCMTLCRDCDHALAVDPVAARGAKQPRCRGQRRCRTLPLPDRTGHAGTGKPNSSITAAAIAEIAESRADSRACRNARLPRHSELPGDREAQPLQRRCGHVGFRISINATG